MFNDHQIFNVNIHDNLFIMKQKLIHEKQINETYGGGIPGFDFEMPYPKNGNRFRLPRQIGPDPDLGPLPERVPGTTPKPNQTIPLEPTPPTPPNPRIPNWTPSPPSPNPQIPNWTPSPLS